MTRRQLLFATLLVISLTVFAGCQTYTQRKALQQISANQGDGEAPGPETRYSVIVAEREAAEAAAREQARREAEERQAQEAAAKAEAAEAERQKAWEEALGQIDALKAENQTLRENLDRLEQTIAEERRQAELKAQQEEAEAAAKAEAERKREEELRKAQLAREAEIKQIPPLDQITFPRRYATENEKILAEDKEVLNTLMLPLDDLPWQEPSTAAEVAESISDLQVPVIFLTGDMENVVAMVRELRMDGVLFEGGAILSRFDIEQVTDHGMVIRYTANGRVRLALANLPQYSVAKAFVEGGDWQTIQKSETPGRVGKVRQIIDEGENTMPTIIGASLYEPSHRDWDTFSPIGYRQMEYPWPLADTFEQESFYDTYRITHFDATTDAGNTIETGPLKERTDYLFTRKVLPLQVSVITAGPESVSGEDQVARYALYGSYLIP